MSAWTIRLADAGLQSHPGRSLQGLLIWELSRGVESVSEGAVTRLRDLTLRERQLPWAPFSILLAVDRDKGSLSPQPISAVGVACSKGASVPIGQVIRRVVIAVRRAGGRRGAGVVGRPVVAGVPARPARPVGGSNAGVIGSGFRWW